MGIVIYNTHWTSYAFSIDAIERLAELPAVVGFKWSTPDTGLIEFEKYRERARQMLLQCGVPRMPQLTRS